MARTPGTLTYRQLLEIPEGERREHGLEDEWGELTPKARELLIPVERRTFDAARRVGERANLVIENLEARAGIPAPVAVVDASVIEVEDEDASFEDEDE